ncbi:MAG: hypothetical protein WA463_06735, partial [Terriglobales bacterium]
ISGDKFDRTHPGVIASAVVARACQGDSRAVKEITESSAKPWEWLLSGEDSLDLFGNKLVQGNSAG